MKICMSVNNSKKKFDGVSSALGGSWQEVFCLCRELVKHMHEVTVFANTTQDKIKKDGFIMIHRDRVMDYVKANEIDLFIFEREDPYFNKKKFPNVKKVLFYLQNTPRAQHPGEIKRWVHSGLIDGVVFVSNWHRDLALKKGFPKDKSIVIRNGYDMYPVTGEKKKNRIIWASNPKRGLRVLAEEIFPALKKEMPEMELHVAGGHKIYNFYDEDVGRRDAEAYQCLFKDWKKKIPKDGYFWYGALEQDKLAQFFHEGTLLVYPLTNFSETGSIVVVQSQAYLTPVITKYRCVMPELVCAVEGNFRPETQNGFCVRNDLPIQGWVDSIKWMINNPDDYKIMQNNCKSWRENYTWEVSGTEANKQFKELIK